MVGQEQSELHVVFTMILCEANFSIDKVTSSYSQVSLI